MWFGGRVFGAVMAYEGNYLITKRSLKGKYSLRDQRKHLRLLNRLQLAVVREMETSKQANKQKARS